MASIKVKFRPAASFGREGIVYYQIIHERKVRRIHSGFHLFHDEWNDHRSIVDVPRSGDRREQILTIRDNINHDLERLLKIDRRLYMSCPEYTSDDIVDAFYHYRTEFSLFKFMGKIITRLRLRGKFRTAETYTAALHSFTAFREGDDILLDRITSELIENYEAWLEHRHVSANTISFYMRILRATYNRAVDLNMIDNARPFTKVYTGVAKTVKRALPLQIIKQIRGLDLSRHSDLDFARDMFFMSFYLRGMSFVDMAFLKETDCRDGYVTYSRRKTGRRLVIAWTREMQAIIDKYDTGGCEYLLPILRGATDDIRRAYRNMGYRINRNLKKIGVMIGLGVPLTLYVARHSWASVANANGIPINIISEGMGHYSESTTRIYLNSLDTTVLDRANAIVIGSLR